MDFQQGGYLYKQRAFNLPLGRGPTAYRYGSTIRSIACLRIKNKEILDISAQNTIYCVMLPKYKCFNWKKLQWNLSAIIIKYVGVGFGVGFCGSRHTV